MGRSELARKRHWESVYGTRPVQKTSWHQETPRFSLSMISNSGFDSGASLIDVGGGASFLVDHLLELGYRDVSVLDVSRAALDQARERLAERAARVQWIEADVLEYVPERQFVLWHDRATFHFLTSPEDRQRYVRVLRDALAPGGQAIIATFAPEGPAKCSGLDIVQYNAEKLGNELGPEFVLEEQKHESHVTPTDRKQPFNFFRFRRANQAHPGENMRFD